MQATTTTLACSPTFAISNHPLLGSFRTRLSPILLPPSPPRLLPFKPLQNNLHAIILPLYSSTVNQEIVQTSKRESEFVEVGYIYNVHGLLGEVSVKPSTDFPELRFSKPGRRWLRQPVSGKDTIREMELVGGRGHPGQKSWILRFGGIDTVDQAKLLVGSTLLVREHDRPELQEGEFYSRDLIGMRVILKETGECVGTVVNVFDSGGNDLLQVMLYRPRDVLDEAEKSKPVEEGVSGHLSWVPFVEAIVPDVDMNRREMRITPPKGLLELNLRLDETSKKERRQLEWRERKKFQRRLIAAKKKLCEMEQNHVFHGLRYGDKSQRKLLADQIVCVNSKLLQQVLENIETYSKRCSAAELISTMRTRLTKSSLKISKTLLTGASGEELGANLKLQEGSALFSKGKVGIVLILNDIEKGGSNGIIDLESSENSLFFFLQKSFSDGLTFLKLEDRVSLPLVLVCPAQEILSVQRLFSDNDYFSFDSNKVWFLEEEKIPVVNSSEGHKGHKILMKSPWEILQLPFGSGGAIVSLSSYDLLENLSEMGVEYVKSCSISQKCVAWGSLLLGFVNSRNVDLGIKIDENTKDSEESFDMVFSLSFLRLLVQQIHKLQFHAIPMRNLHVDLLNDKWVDVVPLSLNSYRFYSSIYSLINACPLEKICVMEVIE